MVWNISWFILWSLESEKSHNLVASQKTYFFECKVYYLNYNASRIGKSYLFDNKNFLMLDKFICFMFAKLFLFVTFCHHRFLGFCFYVCYPRQILFSLSRCILCHHKLKSWEEKRARLTGIHAQFCIAFSVFHLHSLYIFKRR